MVWIDVSVCKLGFGVLEHRALSRSARGNAVKAVSREQLMTSQSTAAAKRAN
jgi:hypothetical protein